MFKYEMHLHESTCSKCSRATGEEYVKACLQKGYKGFCMTDHFYHGNTAIDRGLSWSEFASVYAESYYKTRKYGEKFGIDVIFGLEDIYKRKDEDDDPGKEILIYGISPELVVNTPEIKDMYIDELSAFIRENGGIAVCAHPFRVRSYIKKPDLAPNPDWFDYIEVANRGNHVEDNIKAQIFAAENNMKGISGGDVHSTDAFGTSGLAFDKSIKDENELVKEIINGNYRMIVNSEIV